MSSAPIQDIDLATFNFDPYPVLNFLRNNFPITYVPQLKATLFSKHQDIFICEKNIEIFSSVQPNGLMTKLMGQNMMRKEGATHVAERKAIFPTVSPKTVKNFWRNQFVDKTNEILSHLGNKKELEIVSEFSTQVSAEALKLITGLSKMSWREMDRVSQGMIDGCSNYIGDPLVTKKCEDCTRTIDLHIDAQLNDPKLHEKPSLLSSQLEAGMSMKAIKANIKLAISGGQNEPRDAIAGTIGTLLENRSQLETIISGTKTWLKAFEEYARWMSPIGMSPRRIAKKFNYKNINLYENDMIFFMFGSANRDEEIFQNPEFFDISRDNGPSIAFGAGPHFCAGSWISKTLIAEVALPLFFAHFPNAYLTKPIKFQGWAFRGPKEVILENRNK
jgi:hypothetical protein